MKKRTRTLLSLLLALVLMFSTVGIASATVNETGTQNSVTASVGSVTSMTGKVTCYTNKATGQTTVGTVIERVKVQACLSYSTPATPNFYAHSHTETKESPGTYVSVTTPTLDTSLYTARVAYAGHDAQYTNGVKHIETRDYP